VDINKALDSPWVLKEVPETSSTVTPIKEKASASFPTPYGGVELRKQIDEWRDGLDEADRSKRLILRKAAKALDIKNVEIAILQDQKRHLELQLEDMKPKKRRKVEPDLGRRFVQVAQIQAVQQLAEVTGVHKNKKKGTDILDLDDACLDL
jgi:hypothetical protein